MGKEPRLTFYRFCSRPRLTQRKVEPPTADTYQRPPFCISTTNFRSQTKNKPWFQRASYVTGIQVGFNCRVVYEVVTTDRFITFSELKTQPH